MKFITGFEMFKNGRNIAASLGPIAQLARASDS